LKPTLIRTGFAIASSMLVSICISQSPPQPVSASPSQAAAKPLLLEKAEGEARVWRDPPPGEFMLKVSPQNNGSQHLVFGTEDLHPGDEIPLHKHLGQDEIVFVEAGTVHVHLGALERDLHAGGMVFIPAYTWVSIKPVGNETVSMVFVFSAPGFENLMRCESVPAGQKPTPTTLEERRKCDHQGHVIYKEDEESPKP
jgi:quercetin dioxygenase-like cupin family protein